MKRSARRAVEALDRMRRHLEQAATGKVPSAVTVHELTQIHDAWLAGEPWAETLAERKARLDARRVTSIPE